MRQVYKNELYDEIYCVQMSSCSDRSPLLVDSPVDDYHENNNFVR